MAQLKRTGIGTWQTEISKDLEALIAVFEKKEKAYQAEIRILKEQVQYLRNKLFGRRSEKNT